MKLGHVIPVALSAVLPGIGHIAAGRSIKGIVLFFLFGFAVDGFLYGQALTILPPTHHPVSPSLVRGIALGLGGLLWLYAVIDTTAFARRQRRVESRADEATGHIRDGLIAYLRDDLRAAARAFHAALRINGRDPDALYHLGVVYAAAGHARKARRALRRCIRFDDGGKWDNKAHDHLEAIDAPAAPAAPPEPEKESQGDG